MKIATIHVSGVEARVSDQIRIPQGITGASVVFVYDDPIWAGLTKNVVFDGTETVGILNAGEIVQFPPEVAGVANQHIRVGVCGKNDEGTIVIPTLWADLGAVYGSAYGHFPPPAEQALPVWAQILAMIGTLEELNTDARENLVAAINEVLAKAGTGTGGSVDLTGYAKTEDLPTKTSQLSNDSGFITNAVLDLLNYYSKSQTYTREEIDQKVSAIPKFSIKVVTALPSEDISSTTIYLLKAGNDSGDLYTEYLWAEGKWEILGSQRVDLSGYATENWVQAGYQPKGEYLTKAPVDSVNGKTGAVSLSAADVGARPSSWMPTAQEVGALPSTYTPPDQTAEQVGADPKGTAAAAVSGHNTSAESHGDLRLQLKSLSDRLSAFLDSDDTTLDQLSELIATINSNKSLIEAVTTGKVNVNDIIDNLTTNVSNKPLSAAQGVVLKGLIDSLSASLSKYALASAVPTKVSQLENDKGYLTEHQDISGKLDADKLPEAIDDALAQAKESGEFDGAAGRGIKSIARTSGTGAAGTTDTYTITYTDGTMGTYTVYNGKDGAQGEKGDPYVLTEADKAEIVAMVIESLGGNPVFGYVDENNNIVVSGNLADGTYSVKYELEDGSTVNIGNLVLDSNVYYSVTNTLTNCTNSNSETQAVQGGSYSATITAKTGYELSSVKVTMGGTDISGTAVSGGNISIASVTGNIVITAVATEKAAAEPVTTNITLRNGIRLGSDGTDRTGATGYCATERINLANIPKPCTIHLTKAKWAFAKTTETGYIMTCARNAAGDNLVVGYTNDSIGNGYLTAVRNNDKTTDVTVTVTSDEVAEICFSGNWSHADVTAEYPEAATTMLAEATLTYTPAS